MRAKHDFAGSAADELPLRVGQIVEVKSEVNGDWYMGESEGLNGIFPSSYCEEYRPNPVTVAPPLPTAKRSLPPRADGSGASARHIPPAATYGRSPSPGYGFDHSESDFDSHGYEDADHYATAALSSAPQANPISRGATPSPAMPPGIGGSGKKKAPPPPPSRRSQSSSNILSASYGGSPSGTSSPGGFLAPPTQYRQRSNTATQSQYVSAEASPFGGSEDEGEAEYLDMHTTPNRGGGGGGGNGNGLGAMHMRNEVGEMDDCGVCGCDDFTQNSFKPRGTCSTCFHQHA